MTEFPYFINLAIHIKQFIMRCFKFVLNIKNDRLLTSPVIHFQIFKL